MTEWRELRDYPGYTINEYGVVMNMKRDRPVHPRFNRQGYLMLGLFKDRVQYTKSVAFLVADTFIEPDPNPRYNSVIHLNGDRSDCRAINLMWRPRRFATTYHRMFDDEPYRIGVRVPEINRSYSSLRDFCTTYGLIERWAYVEMINNEPCTHYGWKLERIEN